MTESERTALCRRIDELCMENERLRQENQSIGVAAYELGRKSMADEGWMHCDECPLISNEFTCLLHERLKQYHEWKKSHEISLRR